MTKYYVYADDIGKPGTLRQIKKFKREFEAIDFASDFRNLADYGDMTVIMSTDNDQYVWDHGAASWEKMEG